MMRMYSDKERRIFRAMIKAFETWSTERLAPRLVSLYNAYSGCNSFALDQEIQLKGGNFLREYNSIKSILSERSYKEREKAYRILRNRIITDCSTGRFSLGTGDYILKTFRHDVLDKTLTNN